MKSSNVCKGVSQNPRNVKVSWKRNVVEDLDPSLSRPKHRKRGSTYIQIPVGHLEPDIWVWSK